SMLGVARGRILFVGPWCAFEVPSVIRVAPHAVEVAARGADEHGGKAGGGTFALQGVENFRAGAELGKFHGREIKVGVNADGQQIP
ncbi:MAG: hypothetical protein RLZ22_992, partial [Verrucomicrobiota bacterium]